MTALYDVIGVPFGYIMNVIYKICGSYTLSIILFVVLVRLLMLPLTYKTQLYQKRVHLFDDKLKAIRRKYKDDPDRNKKIGDEQTKLLASEGLGYNGSMLPSFLQIFCMFGIIDVIYKPLTHVLHISKDVRFAAVDIVSKLTDSNLSPKSLMSELEIMKQFPASADAFSGLSENFMSRVVELNEKFTMFGVNLTTIPTALTEFEDPKIVLLWSIPLINTVLSIAFSAIDRKSRGQNLDIMTILMSLITFLIGMQLPLGINLYWLCGTIISYAITVAVNHYLTDERVRSIHDMKKKDALTRKAQAEQIYAAMVKKAKQSKK